jgi:hypothetical protein
MDTAFLEVKRLLIFSPFFSTFLCFLEEKAKKKGNQNYFEASFGMEELWRNFGGFGSYRNYSYQALWNT